MQWTKEHSEGLAEFFTLAARYREEAAEKIRSAEALEDEAAKLISSLKKSEAHGR